MPDWFYLTLLIALSCGTVLCLVLLRTRRSTADDDPSETPDVIEYMTMMIGVVYAIVLGLAIAGVWEARNVADEVVHDEAQALHEVYERAQVLPADERDRIRADVDAYVHHTVTKEWPYMETHGQLTTRGGALLRALREDVQNQQPQRPNEEQASAAMSDRVAAIDTARTERAGSAEPTLPGVVWLGLFAGAVVSIGMLFTLQIQRSGRELLLAGLFTALIGFLLFLVWCFDSPFSRGLSNPVEAFTALFPHAGAK